MSNNILYVVHNLGPEVPESRSTAKEGGCEKLTYALAHKLSTSNNCYILYPDAVGKREIHLHKISKFKNELVRSYKDTTLFEKMDFFINIIKEFNINLIHYQHLIGLPVEWVLMGSIMKIPQVMTIHDYYMVCEEHFLENDKYVTCDVPASISKCQTCLANKLGATPTAVMKRRTLMTKILERMDKIYFPSKSVKSNYSRVYPQLHDKFQLYPVGVPTSTFFSSINTREIRPNALCVGIRNYLTYVKGWVPMVNVIRLAEKRYPYDIRFVILSEDASDEVNTFLHDFTNVDMDGMGANVDLIWIPSIAKETFSILATEATRAGLPVLCARKGALAERLNEEGTFFYPEDASPDEILEHYLAPLTSEEGRGALVNKTQNIVDNSDLEAMHTVELSANFFSLQYQKLIN